MMYMYFGDEPFDDVISNIQVHPLKNFELTD